MDYEFEKEQKYNYFFLLFVKISSLMIQFGWKSKK